jgi:hypothetical protein
VFVTASQKKKRKDGVGKLVEEMKSKNFLDLT